MKNIFKIVMAVLFSVNVQSQIIVIDPGHGYGATTTDNPDGRTAIEIETSLEVGLRTRNLIQNSCTWTVQMTRTTNLNSWISVTQRGQMANNWNADRLLSIHCNAGGGTGTETFYCTQDDTNTPPDVAFAQKIQTNMVSGGSWNNRRCVEDNSFLAYHLGVLRYSAATGCLNEIGFVDSATDAAKLTSSTWRDAFALSYFNALKSDLNLTCATTPAPGSFTLTASPQCNGTTSQVALSWTASANATSYDIYKDGALWDSNITTTTYTNTSGVVAGVTYAYSVKAKNAGTTQTTNSNGTVSVTALNCAIPGAFTITVTPECSGTGTPRNKLTWTASANATAYNVYRNGVLYASSLTGTTYTNTAVTSGTSYSYYVVAKNTTATQTTNSNGTQTVVALNCAAPGAFTISATAECSGTTSRVNLSWTASANATSYDVYRNGSLYASDVTGTQFLNTFVTVGTTYTYSMMAKNNIGTVANSNVTVSATAILCTPGSFTATATPTCSGTTSAINVTWTASLNATSYDIYRNGNLYASDIAGTSFLNTYLITAGTTYTYYVKAKNSAGTLNNSNGTLSATATNCSGAKISEGNEVKEAITISFYPNPTDGILNLEINRTEVQNIHYLIMDINGRVVKEANLETERTIHLSQFPAATYFIRVVVDGQEFVKQIIKK
ncbi:N-acetylmuramoyl-L-alanine amidase [Flavobacterium facile]|uniref:N-acetylmuramoyl-L-alanine amidase n=1 Tax=Flavobacterium facile TaxID=2893174 RepID=UPI002E7957DC|nr:N-acetylmuramoyl-L-alanine amidase [Flavobacterium sp. T-12]